MTDAIERYLLLGLRLGRHVDGLVDAYYGPPELADAVATEPPNAPAELVAEADSLAQTVAAATDLDEQRRGWLSSRDSCRASEICAIASRPGAASAWSTPTAWFQH